MAGIFCRGPTGKRRGIPPGGDASLWVESLSAGRLATQGPRRRKNRATHVGHSVLDVGRAQPARKTYDMKPHCARRNIAGRSIRFAPTSPGMEICEYFPPCKHRWPRQVFRIIPASLQPRDGLSHKRPASHRSFINRQDAPEFPTPTFDGPFRNIPDFRPWSPSSGARPGAGPMASRNMSAVQAAHPFMTMPELPRCCSQGPSKTRRTHRSPDFAPQKSDGSPQGSTTRALDDRKFPGRANSDRFPAAIPRFESSASMGVDTFRSAAFSIAPPAAKAADAF